MGKRSEFERIPADRYPTPRPAVLPLVPHICGIREYAEPCDGGDDDDGRALIRHLREFDLTCVYAVTFAPAKMRARLRPRTAKAPRSSPSRPTLASAD